MQRQLTGLLAVLVVMLGAVGVALGAIEWQVSGTAEAGETITIQLWATGGETVSGVSLALVTDNDASGTAVPGAWNDDFTIQHDPGYNGTDGGYGTGDLLNANGTCDVGTSTNGLLYTYTYQIAEGFSGTIHFQTLDLPDHGLQSKVFLLGGVGYLTPPDFDVVVGGGTVSYTLGASVVGGNGSVSPTSGTYDEGAEVTVTATPDAGYRVASWSGTDDDSVTTTTNTVTMDDDKTVTVVFEAIPPTMVTLTTSVAGGNGSVSPSSEDYEEGTEVTVTASPDEGYQVASWSGTDDDSLTTTTNTVTMDDDKTVTVAFEAIPPTMVTLTTSVAGGQGTISPDGGEYEQGSVVPLTAEPDPNYVLSQWSGTDDDTSTALTNTVTMSSDKTVTVLFDPNAVEQYVLTAAVDGGHGSVSPTGGVYDPNTVVTLTASPDAGYRVRQWVGTADDLSTATTNTVVMDDDKSVTVAFEEIPEVSLDITSGLLRDGRADNSDMLMISIDFPVTVEDLAGAEALTFSVENTPSGLTVPFSTDDVRFGRFMYFGAGGMVIINFNQGTLDLRMMNTDLTGLRNPLEVMIEGGSFQALATADSSVVSVPISFLAGIADGLELVTRPLVAGQLMMVQARYVSADNLHIARDGLAMTMTWGEQSFTIPAASFTMAGSRSMAINAAVDGGGTALAIVDANSGLAIILLRGVTIDPTSGDVTFALSFGSFDESVQVAMP